VDEGSTLTFLPNFSLLGHLVRRALCGHTHTHTQHAHFKMTRVELCFLA